MEAWRCMEREWRQAHRCQPATNRLHANMQLELNAPNLDMTRPAKLMNVSANKYIGFLSSGTSWAIISSHPTTQSVAYTERQQCNMCIMLQDMVALPMTVPPRSQLLQHRCRPHPRHCCCSHRAVLCKQHRPVFSCIHRSPDYFLGV